MRHDGSECGVEAMEIVLYLLYRCVVIRTIFPATVIQLIFPFFAARPDARKLIARTNLIVTSAIPQNLMAAKWLIDTKIYRREN